MRQADIRRIALWLLIASVALTAAIAIWAVAFGDFDDTTGKILGTSLSVAGGSLLALAAATGWERSQVVAWLGIAGAVIGFGLVIAGIWLEPEGSVFWKAAVSAIIVGVAGAWIALLGNARLAASHRWVGNLAAFCGVALAALVLVALWAEVDSSGFGRVIGVFAVLVAALSVVVPVIHRLDAVPAEPTGSPEEWQHCPRCGEVSVAASGVLAQCPSCDAAYRVDSPR
ncbi:MAG: hypothetical protein HKN93_07780 [Acidimicrobiia bacterium]|nr:hypothetical protein [Acidimicrobiia bacterium]